jgi:AMMECR1 domain-containing protein
MHPRSCPLRSALKDERFEPIDLNELPELACKLSVLHSFEVCRDPYEWTIGKHGILINFVANGQKWSATYLPEIAYEHGMSHQVAIAELVRKSGFRGHVSNVLSKLHVQRYQTNLACLTYDQWWNFAGAPEW